MRNYPSVLGQEGCGRTLEVGETFVQLFDETAGGDWTDCHTPAGLDKGVVEVSVVLLMYNFPTN